MIFAPINQINKHKAKIYNHCAYTQVIIKKIHFFSSESIKMSGKNIKFDDKKIEKSDSYKNKKIINIDDIDVNKILVSEKEPYGQKMHLNTLIDTMIMMLLDHYV